MKPLSIDSRTKVTRLPERQLTDRAALHHLLHTALVAHVGLVREGAPVVLPMACAHDGDSVLLHGSSGGGLLRAAALGEPIAVSVSVLDGLVFARSLFDSSMNYRSAMIRGCATSLTGAAKLAALRKLADHLMPGRWDEVRPPTAKELAATLVLRLPLEEVSLKVRAGGPSPEPGEGESRSVWAGVLPLRLQAARPIPSPDNEDTARIPDSVREWPQRSSRGPDTTHEE